MNKITEVVVVLGVAAVALAQPVLAQRVEERRATPTGSRGDRGKCTIEVNVDDVAEVEIVGDLGRLRTLSGQPAVWRRFECSDPLPRGGVADFRYSGVDGRGRQFLLRDPRNNGGVAVIRIEDPKGGREGYTFDIEWRGGPQGGFSGGGDRDRDRDRDRGRDGDRDRDQRFEPERAIAMCQDAVRDRANRDYGYRDLDFRRVAFDDNPGRRDYVVGSFVGRRGPVRDEFTFSCGVDFDGRRLRDVDVRRR